MSAPRLVQLNSATEIRSVAAEWDDLWRRSEVTVPTARAELIAHWIEHSAPAAVRALAVERDGRFVAALPLIGGRLKRYIPIGRLPYNNWSWAGDLLLWAGELPGGWSALGDRYSTSLRMIIWGWPTTLG